MMHTATTNLINAVDRERQRLDLSDRQFSIQVLGISPSYWCLLKQGRRALTLDLIRTFMVQIPAVTPEVGIYIMRQGNDGQDGEMPEKRHDKSEVSEENHTPHTKVARKPSKSA